MSFIVCPEQETGALERAAELICMAARTAPKGKGKDLLATAIVNGEEKRLITDRMRLIAQREQMPFFERDAGNVDASPVLLLFGSRKEPLLLPCCGFCGFADCEAMEAAGGTCSFNTIDLGIAVSSAAARASDLRLDNRIMFTAGKAVLELGLLGPEVQIALGLPLSVTGKSPFFDRK
ncbi:MAG: ferredoxin [Desulfuromonas sp.]|nr:MAG: ferredoxin [Desulfuromonas sp.]